VTTQSSGSARRRSIRRPILAIAWIPSLVLLLVGMGVAATIGWEGHRQQQTAAGFDTISRPFSQLLLGLFVERHASVVYTADRTTSITELAAARAANDALMAQVIPILRSLQATSTAPDDDFANKFAQAFTQLQALRKGIDTRAVPLLKITGFYSAVTDGVTASFTRSAATMYTVPASFEESVAVSFLVGIDALHDADSFAAANFAGAGLAPEEFSHYSNRLGAARSHLTVAGPLMASPYKEAVAKLMASQEWKRLTRAHDTVQADMMARAAASAGKSASENGGSGDNSSGANSSAAAASPAGRGNAAASAAAAVAGRVAAPMDAATWNQTYAKVSDALREIERADSVHGSNLAAEEADWQVRRSIVIGLALVLLAAVVFVVATMLSNRLVARLRRLRSETLALANVRLPAIVGRLRDGQPVDLEHEMPPLHFGRDEVGEVAEAFEEAQRTAVTAAVREAEARAGFRAVFLDIAHRNQSIVYRQLKVLDQAERAQEDPDQLSLLFQMDHLATRSRRNAENLIILGGGQPGRQWRIPVPLLEIVRSAISEAEDYVRVSVGSLPRVEIVGSVVGDLIHLVAELVDNATSFSPPMSRVEVRANVVGRGLVLEIEDQGLGIEAGQLEELNTLLHEPPDFQVMALADEPRLGLFVVAQLANRHGIRVTLTASPAYGGTRVVVLLPMPTLAGGPDDSRQALGAGRLELDGPPPSVPAGASTGPGSGPSGLRLAPPPGPVPATGPRSTTAPGGRTVLPGGPTAVPGGPTSPDGRTFQAPWLPGAVPTGQPVAPHLAQAAPQPPPVRDSPNRVIVLPPDPSDPQASGVGASARRVPAHSASGFTARAAAAPDHVGRNAGIGTPSSGTTGGIRPALPRRNPQSHLSPRLKEDPSTVGPDPYPVRELPDAEQARSRMSALQRGTLRGRTTDPEAAR
jgi:signal transduction histidine kinase